MKIKKFIVNPFHINSYIYYDEQSSEGIIIDPAAFYNQEEKKILDFINKNNITIKYIIDTHGHIDHVLGNHFAKKNFNCDLLIHKDDLFLLNNTVNQGLLYGLDVSKSPEPDIYITEKLVLKINNADIMFIHTPGHTPGGICIVDHFNKTVFTGDTIFKSTIGRTDLPGGNFDMLINSIKNNLFNRCKNEYILYPGHMEETTIEYEKKYNPFLNR